MKLLAKIALFLVITIIISCDNRDEIYLLNGKATRLLNFGWNKEVIDSGLYYLDEAIKLNEDFYITYSNKEIFLNAKNDFNGLIENNVEMQRLDPENTILIIKEGSYYELLGDTVKAKELFEKGINKFKVLLKEDSDFDLRKEYFISLIMCNKMDDATKELNIILKEYPEKGKILISYISSDFFKNRDFYR